MEKINFDKLMIEEIKKNQDKNITPKLLLHCCCAPCSSAVLEKLIPFFNITIIFYNPNITLKEEYIKRCEELKKFVLNKPFNNVSIIEEDYDPSLFLLKTKGLENDKEGGKRCYLCYEMRLERTALIAKEKGFDYFATTLSISPYKNSNWLNEIGSKLSNKYNISYLYSDFKKRQGYIRSITLSKEYKLYRQDYCGCPFSKKERENVKLLRSQNLE